MRVLIPAMTGELESAFGIHIEEDKQVNISRIFNLVTVKCLIHTHPYDAVDSDDGRTRA